MQINKRTYICTINTFKITFKIDKNSLNKYVLIVLYLAYRVFVLFHCLRVGSRQSRHFSLFTSAVAPLSSH